MADDDELFKQNDHLRQQLGALNNLSPAARRRFQLLLVRCQGCGDVMLEVMATKPYPVIRSRSIQSGEFPRPEPGASTTEVQQHWKAFFETRQEQIRRERPWRFVPIPWPIPAAGNSDRRNSSIPIACKCRNAGLISMSWIFDKLTEGRRDVTFPRHHVQ